MSAQFWNGLIHSIASAQRVGCPDTYRGWTIHYDPPPIPIRDFDWQATGPNYDAWTDDGQWTDNGEKAEAPTRDALIDAIDDWFEEHGE